MRDTDLLQMALGLLPPWMVAGSTFDARLSVPLLPAPDGRLRRPVAAMIATVPRPSAVETGTDTPVRMPQTRTCGTAAESPLGTLPFRPIH